MTNKEKELKRLNKEKIKEYKKQLKSEIFDPDNEIIYNENGEALIECKIGKAENIFNQYDLAKQRTITDDFEKYLMDEVEIIPMTENVAIKMYVDDNFTTDNENQVKKALKNHFGFKITTDKVKIKRNDLWAGLFLICGFICLILSPFVYKWFQNSYFPAYESTLIMTWFFLWEGTGMAFLDRSEISAHRYNMLRLYNASVSFVRVGTGIPAPTIPTKQEGKIAPRPIETKPKKRFSILSIFKKKNKE